MNGRAKGHHRVEIKGASIGPAAKRARECRHHGLAGPNTNDLSWPPVRRFQKCAGRRSCDELSPAFDSLLLPSSSKICLPKSLIPTFPGNRAYLDDRP
jgi:hypothetical protein